MNKTNNRRSFENSWSITYRKPDYDALSDPHASFYFYNKSVKKHLLKLRKSIDYEGKEVEKKQVTKLISQRLRYRANSIVESKGDVYFKPLKSEESMSSIRRSTQTLQTYSKNGSKKSLRKKKRSKQLSYELSGQEKALILPTINNDAKKEKEDKIENYNLGTEQAQKSNKTNHLRFMNFLNQKKKKLGKVDDDKE